jgi:hypothetical protein
MTPLEQLKLRKHREHFGDLTATEALQQALGKEQTKKDCGPFDPAYGLFSDEQRNLEEMALLLEKEQRKPPQA